MLRLDLIKQSVASAPGTGPISLGTASAGFIGIQDHPDTTDGMAVEYIAIDGNNKEFGIGTYAATGDVLTRTWIQGKIESGVYSKNPGTGVSLTANAVIQCGPVATNMNFRGCELSLTANLSIPGSLTTINWDNEIIDTDGFHESIINPDRITIPAGLGIKKVEITFSGVFAINSTGERNLWLFNNTGSIISAASHFSTSSVNKPAPNATTGTIDVSDGDWFNIKVYQSSGGSLDLEADIRTRFKMKIIE